MSNDTPNNNPHNPPYGDPGATQPVPPQPLGQGAVNGSPQGQQYGMTGGKYGTSEYNPNQYTGTMDRPSTVDKLLKLTLASLGLYVLNGIIGLIAASSVDYTQMYRDMGLSTEMADQSASQMAMTTGPVASIISLIIGLALYFLVYNGLKKGKNWARILGTVLAAIAILSGIFGLLGVFIYPAPWNIIMAILMIVKVVVDILWIVTAFRAPTSAWFNQNRVQR